MSGMGSAIVCTRGGGCRLVRLQPINFDDPQVRQQAQHFAAAYQAAVAAKRDPGRDPEVLRLLPLTLGTPRQPRLPGF
jgi:hypothetical protein